MPRTEHQFGESRESQDTHLQVNNKSADEQLAPLEETDPDVWPLVEALSRAGFSVLDSSGSSITNMLRRRAAHVTFTSQSPVDGLRDVLEQLRICGGLDWSLTDGTDSTGIKWYRLSAPLFSWFEFDWLPHKGWRAYREHASHDQRAIVAHLNTGAQPELMRFRHSDAALDAFDSTTKRLRQRYIAFEEFCNTAYRKIMPLALADKGVAYFSPYDFRINRGGLEGGWDQKSVTVMFGNRFFEVTQGEPQVLSGESKRRQIVHSENGAHLRYQRDARGEVLCLLFPATRDNETPLVSMILLDRFKDATPLSSDRVLKRHIRCLAAYMAHTSVVGSPTLLQQLTYARIRHWKPHASGGVVRRSSAWRFAGKLLTWFVTVGCSGLVLFAMQEQKPDVIGPALLKANQEAEKSNANQELALESIRDVLSREDPLDASARIISELEKIRVSLEAARTSKMEPNQNSAQGNSAASQRPSK